MNTHNICRGNSNEYPENMFYGELENYPNNLICSIVLPTDLTNLYIWSFVRYNFTTSFSTVATFDFPFPNFSFCLHQSHRWK